MHEVYRGGKLLPEQVFKGVIYHLLPQNSHKQALSWFQNFPLGIILVHSFGGDGRP